MMPKKLYAIMLSILGLAMIGYYFAFLREEKRNSKLSAEVPAVVTATTNRRTSDPETGQERSVDVLVNFKYEIDGVKYEKTTRKSKIESLAFIPWERAKVCYDPNDLTTIENAELFPSNHKCG